MRMLMLPLGKMGRTGTKVAGVSLVFLLLLALEVWVYSMEGNKRVRALRMHVLSLHQLLVSAGGWYIWKRVTRIFRGPGGGIFSTGTAVRAGLLLLLGSAQLSVGLGLLFVDREPAFVTRISNTCIGISFFLCTSLVLVDSAFFCIRKIFPSLRRGGRRSERTEGKWKFLVALVAAVGLSFGGLLGMAQFTVERLDIPIRGLSPALNGTTVVQLSDIHLGGYSGRSTLQRIVDQTNQLSPDVVVITGDLVDGAVVFLREIVEPLRGLRGKHGVFFATGNHEYYTGDVDNWIAELPKLGVTPLINSRVCLLGRGGRGGEGGEEGECEGGMYLAGIEDITTRTWGIYGVHHSMDLEAALRSRTRGTPTLVLAHQPKAAVETIQWSDVRLTLAGHTHAGQFFPMSLLVYLFNPFFVGLYEPKPGVFVYVSPGTVYYWIPFRHYRPEITHFTLLTA